MAKGKKKSKNSVKPTPVRLEDLHRFVFQASVLIP